MAKTRETRLVLIEPGGHRMDSLALDLSRIPNANASVPIFVAVEQQCDLGHWHQQGAAQLPLYDGVIP